MNKIRYFLSIAVCGIFFMLTLPAQAVVTYIHTDILGSPVAESDNNGTLIKKLHYKPFGETLEAKQNTVGYTGHMEDKELGLTYMQARYYDPLIGRFYSNDPVGYTARNPVMSFNRYLYVNNNPYKYTDSDGEFLNFVIGAGTGALINYSAQAWTTGIDNVDYSQVAVAAAIGATGVGVGEVVASSVAQIGLSGGVAVAVNIAGNAVGGAGIGVIGALTNTAVDGIQGDSSGTISLGQMAAAAIDGAVFSALGARSAPAISNAVTNASGKILGPSRTLNKAGIAVVTGGSNAIANLGDLKNTIVEQAKDYSK
jgi:RHS repeat-associated protein